jgi:hypothetical protein
LFQPERLAMILSSLSLRRSEKADAVNTPEAGCHEMVRHVYLPPLRDAKRSLASGNPTRMAL